MTTDAIIRLGEIIQRKLRCDDPVMRQAYARRFIEKVVVAPDTIIISGPVKPLEVGFSEHPDQMKPQCPSLAGSGAPYTTQTGTQTIGKS